MQRKGVRLGQHFLKHGWAAGKLAHAFSLSENETIVEIGPGKGALTKELLKRGSVIAIEKDSALVETLHTTFAHEIQSGRLRVVEQDIRDFKPETLHIKPGTYVVAANIPYYITGEIIRQFLTAEVQPRAMALLVQKEVAHRIVDSKESILSISVKAYGTPKVVAKVGKSHFSPPPSVDSAILLIDNISKKFFIDISEDHFFEVVRAGFASKRKFLSNNLSSRFDKDLVRNAIAKCLLPEKIRAENVGIDQWKSLARKLV